VIERLETLAHGTPEEVVLQVLERAQPREAQVLIEQIALPADVGSAALDSLLADGRVILVGIDGVEAQAAQELAGGSRYLVTADGWREMVARIQAALTSYHQAHPLRRGMPREELRSRLQDRYRNLAGRLFSQVVARAEAEGMVGGDASNVWHAEHTVQLSDEQRRAVDALLRRFEREPYVTPSPAECVSALGEELFNALLGDGTLVRISSDVVYTHQVLTEMETRIAAFLRKQGSATVAEVRDLFGASRKYIVALMEYLDQKRVTRRVGDARVLRGRQGPQGEER
jgi:selenocysteine-specific elongation factor